MKNQEIAPARTGKRMFGFLIDSFFIYILLVLYMMLAINIFLKNDIAEFYRNFSATFDNYSPENLQVIHVEFFLKSEFYRKLEIILLTVFVIPFLYFALPLFTNWSATPGQKIMGIKTLMLNNEKPKWYRIVARSFFIILPWFFIFLLAINNFLANYGYGTILGKGAALFLLFIFATYYDLALFTKDKLTFPDFLSGTKVVQKYASKENGGFFRYFFPDFRGMYSSLTDLYKEKMAEAKKIKAEYNKAKNTKNKK